MRQPFFVSVLQYILSLGEQTTFGHLKQHNYYEHLGMGHFFKESAYCFLSHYADRCNCGKYNLPFSKEQLGYALTWSEGIIRAVVSVLIGYLGVRKYRRRMEEPGTEHHE